VSEPRSVAQLLDLAERVLKDSTHIFEDHDNRREAEDLLAFCLDEDADDLVDSDVPPKRLRERYLSMVARRAGGEPFPFLVGTIEFYGLELEVRPGPFVPRPSSELTVDRAVKRLRRRKSSIAVDVCTGSGPIALAMADDLPRAEVWGADIDAAGLNQARRNARLLGIHNVTFKRSDMYDGLPKRLRGSVDVITGHIPYVPVDEIDDLPTEVRGYEPMHTLSDESSDGLGLIRRAAHEAHEWLRPGGWLLMEVSTDLPKKVARICRRAGLKDIGEASDDDGLSVVVEARAPS
jgi:release factor glutamine methyltransferase